MIAAMEDLAFRILNIRSGVWALVLLFSCFLSSNIAEAEPIPRNFYPISLSNDPERLVSLSPLRKTKKNIYTHQLSI